MGNDMTVNLKEVEKAVVCFEGMTNPQRDIVVDTINAALLSRELGTGTWKQFMTNKVNKTVGAQRRYYRILAKFTHQNIEDFIEAYTEKDEPLTVQKTILSRSIANA